jgi:hypothetical protein
MTDIEFDILDELYFVTSFAELLSNLGISKEELKHNLLAMTQKNWVNYYLQLDGEQNPPIDLSANIESLYFLASKKGLFAHNSK